MSLLTAERAQNDFPEPTRMLRGDWKYRDEEVQNQKIHRDRKMGGSESMEGGR